MLRKRIEWEILCLGTRCHVLVHLCQSSVCVESLECLVPCPAEPAPAPFVKSLRSASAMVATWAVPAAARPERPRRPPRPWRCRPGGRQRIKRYPWPGGIQNITNCENYWVGHIIPIGLRCHQTCVNSFSSMKFTRLLNLRLVRWFSIAAIPFCVKYS